MMGYKNTLNYELREYYNYNWNNDKLDNGRDKMEKIYNRICKYITSKKTKHLILEDGCYNMDVVKCELNEDYELTIHLGDGKTYRLNLENIIEDKTSLRYDRKYHTIYFI